MRIVGTAHGPLHSAESSATVSRMGTLRNDDKLCILRRMNHPKATSHKHTFTLCLQFALASTVLATGKD